MGRPSRSMNRDWPQLESVSFAALAAGSATDPAVDMPICSVPDAKLFFGAITANEIDRSSLPIDSMTVRQAVLISQGSANTSASGSTNYCDLRLNQYRKGVLQGCLAYLSLDVSTTIGTAITSSNINTKVAVTPASMTGIVAGMTLAIDTSTSLEYVTVLSTTSTTFTAVFTKTHTTAATVVAVLVPQMPVPLIPAVAASTTVSGALGSTGSQTVTPATMYGIRVGDSLLIDASGTPETVVVTAVTATTFTAVFASTHSGGYTVATTVPASASTPRWPTQLLPGDTVSFNRISNNTTGLATPAMLVQVDWVPALINR